jgi:hypothetical protein
MIRRRQVPVTARLGAAALVCAAALAAGVPAAAPAAAQAPPDARWRVLDTPHFRITFSEGLEELARHAAERAEVARVRLIEELGRTPEGTVEIVVTDHVDYSNGLATPFFNNRIYLFAKPPVEHLALGYHHDWLDMVLVHELTHIFHLDHRWRRLPVLRSVFGRVPASWPFFPVLGTPIWSLEGLATYMESRVTGMGRVNGSVHEMFVRTAALAGELQQIDEQSGNSPVWPAGQRPYVYGSLFYEHLAERYGADVHLRLVERTADHLLPPFLAFDGIGRRSFGRSFTAEWRAWLAALEEGYAVYADALAAEELTLPERLTEAGYYAFYPRFSPDGTRLAYLASDGRSVAGVRILDAATGERMAHHRVNQFGGEMAPAAWLPDGSGLVVPQFEFHGPYRVFQDLYMLRSGRLERLTRGLRIGRPDVAPDGRRVVAVQSDAGRVRLVVLDLVSGRLRPLSDYRADVSFAAPRWSPDGRRIAVARWHAGGDFDLALLDTTGAVLAAFARGPYLVGTPAWTPGGDGVVFWSDRTGIANLYHLEPGGAGQLRQITHLLTGAFHPEISPDGRWIYFTGYDVDGFHLERIPFDPASWRDPAPAAPPWRPRPSAPPLPPPGRAWPRTALPPEPPGPVGLAVAERAYTPGPSLAPRYWIPLAIERSHSGTFWGIATEGRDVIDRHAYSISAGFAPGAGRFLGRSTYAYAGLGNPVLVATVDRDWSGWRSVLPDDQGHAVVVEREDGIWATALFQAPRWRRSASFTTTVDLVQRQRHVASSTVPVTLRDTADRLLGFRGRLGYATAVAHPFSISREDGVVLSLAGRHRRDLAPGATLSRSYDELSLWSAGYRALGRRGFANDVLALRLSALRRDGPGASPLALGGASGVSENLGITTFGGGGIFLPVRGFSEGARIGTRGWSGSAEYRLPLRLVGRGIATWPVFLDRVSGALFLDAGDAWCVAGNEARGCPPRAEGGLFALTPLAAAGIELNVDVTLLFNADVRIRAGVAHPVTGSDDPGPTFYFRLGPSY